MPLDVILGIDLGTEMPKRTSEDFVTRMANVFEDARRRQEKLQQYNKRRRDKTRHHALFEENDPVLVWEPPRALNKEELSRYSGRIPKKLQYRWSPSIWFIKKPLTRHARNAPTSLYIIRDHNGAERKTLVNVNRLRHFYPWTDAMPTTQDDETPPDDDDEMDEAEPFTTSPVINASIGDYVLIPTERQHTLPYVIGEITNMGKLERDGHRNINVHLYGDIEHITTTRTEKAQRTIVDVQSLQRQTRNPNNTLGP